MIAISKGKFAGGFTGNVSDSQLKEFMDKVYFIVFFVLTDPIKHSP